MKFLSRVQLLATPWTAAYRAPPSMRFSRQEHWSGLPLPFPNQQGKDLQIESSQYMGIPDHLTHLLRNLHAGQEATVRTGHGTMDWF